VFKAVTGEDDIIGEYKYGAGFSFRPFARLVVAANEFPRAKDASEGFYRRFLIVPFLRQFEVDPVVGRELDRGLADPPELSGVLNKALDALPKVLDKGIEVPGSVQAMLWEHRALTDPLAHWLDQHTVDGPEERIEQKTLIDAYRDYCRFMRIPVTSETAFGQGLTQYRPNVERRQATRVVDGKRVWCYAGIRLRE
jgi:putative DNA primase/helicase